MSRRQRAQAERPPSGRESGTAPRARLFGARSAPPASHNSPASQPPSRATNELDGKRSHWQARHLADGKTCQGARPSPRVGPAFVHQRRRARLGQRGTLAPASSRVARGGRAPFHHSRRCVTKRTHHNTCASRGALALVGWARDYVALGRAQRAPDAARWPGRKTCARFAARTGAGRRILARSSSLSPAPSGRPQPGPSVAPDNGASALSGRPFGQLRALILSHFVRRRCGRSWPANAWASGQRAPRSGASELLSSRLDPAVARRLLGPGRWQSNSARALNRPERPLPRLGPAIGHSGRPRRPTHRPIAHNKCSGRKSCATFGGRRRRLRATKWSAPLVRAHPFALDQWRRRGAQLVCANSGGRLAAAAASGRQKTFGARWPPIPAGLAGGRAEQLQCKM